ncbi:MAG: cob(I)yrinic acid a,c-diamide adenosyltransferase [Nitrososphaeria archaeon]|nr:cob(I)yrinic acid a,c-diamide adenosyltransferase [Conexivisphaerales archaeon]
MKPLKRGMVIVYHGNGKGKTTAAIGMLVRALGHGYKVAYVQFLKSSVSGETKFLSRTSGVLFYSGGLGFVGIMGDKKSLDEHRKKALETLEFARKILKEDYYIVVLDEINCALGLGLLNLDDVIDVIRSRKENVNVVLTGCTAPEKLIEIADIVTEMVKVKHIYDQGYLAKIGVDF